MTQLGFLLTAIINKRMELILSPNQNQKILIRRSLVFLWKVPETFLFSQKERFPDVSA